jgi:2-dehydropantoate 2-reductase
MNIAPQRYIDAAEGRGLEAVEAEMGGAEARARAGGRPSMLQDVMRGRRTEIDHLNGFVVGEGRRVGVSTPFNEKVVELYRARGPRFTPDPGNLKPLLEMLP